MSGPKKQLIREINQAKEERKHVPLYKKKFPAIKRLPRVHKKTNDSLEVKYSDGNTYNVENEKGTLRRISKKKGKYYRK